MSYIYFKRLNILVALVYIGHSRHKLQIYVTFVRHASHE